MKEKANKLLILTVFIKSFGMKMGRISLNKHNRGFFICFGPEKGLGTVPRRRAIVVSCSSQMSSTR